MDYNIIETLLKTGADKTERINMIMSESQSKAQGIIDGPTGTDCEANYWEREYGLVDAVIALYDMLSGRDTDGLLTILGSLAVFNGGISVDGSIASTSAITASGGVSSSGSSISGKSVYSDNGLGPIYGGRLYIGDSGVDTGLWFQELYLSGKVGEINKIIKFDGGNFIIDLPYADSDYQGWGEGGNFRVFGATTMLDVNNRGAMGIGGHELDDVTESASLTIQRRDSLGSAGDTFLRATTIGADDRDSTSLLLEDVASHSTLATTRTGIKLSTNRASDNLVQFIFDDIVKATFDENGDLSLRNIVTTGGINIAGDLAVDNIDMIGDLILTSGGINVSSDITCIGLQADAYGIFGSFLRVGELSNQYVKIWGNNLDQQIEFKDANDYNFIMGFIDAGINGRAYMLGNFTTLVCQSGPTLGSPAGEFLFDIQSAGTASGGILFSHQAETYQLFIDADGVVKSAEVGGFPTGFGPTTTGHTRVPYANGSIDITDQVALEAAIDLVSEKNKGALVVVNDIACGLVLCSSESTTGDWKVVSGHRKRIYEQAPAEATHTLAQEECFIHNTRTAVATSFIVLPDIQTIKGRCVTIKDASANASQYSITITTESTAEIEHSSELIINTDGTSVSLYCDGTNWFIY